MESVQAKALNHVGVGPSETNACDGKTEIDVHITWQSGKWIRNSKYAIQDIHYLENVTFDYVW